MGRAERDLPIEKMIEVSSSALCRMCYLFDHAVYPGHANLPLSEATNANVTAVFPLTQAVDARCCFCLYPTIRKQDEIRTSTDRIAHVYKCDIELCVKSQEFRQL